MKKQMTEWVTLAGKGVTLEPLTHQRHDEFLQAIEESELHKLWYTGVPSPAELSNEIERRLFLHEKGTMLPFAIVDHRTGKAVGMTTYMNIDSDACRVEIGYTWYARSVQRTHINTEAKYLLLKYAFEELGCIAVEFRTHFFNHQSRKAIERLGAKLDGILRSHGVSKDGSIRDTCVYSIINGEWPAVKIHLEWLMVKPR
ncbi:GNAT family N-acetyltransferase [Photorhabdus bodei]|uniref:N-acetyltransferase n=1 Tax=Photorhabdus bodei TaxID=2029681 RepID=A0A329X9J9_9GAMM|nr:GNAT family protein [Photorhabdus bodei]NDL00124.1 GNAT family N-acetyltransferase [Photorhabdus bodei]NDL04259.1 GNAT family N-acetyltransferase [Photorhabdus bodei]NDL08540.1 GNAT family N-acetyltransferase [Photorhabdus bodei]RAX11903.1 N-acetyltransferase [Photorhabdus bodei]